MHRLFLSAREGTTSAKVFVSLVVHILIICLGFAIFVSFLFFSFFFFFFLVAEDIPITAIIEFRI
jgi:uncharacterized membrane protein